MKKLTIVTINFNNVFGLQKTIESVLSQTVKDFEYYIVDGGSNDGSVEYLESTSVNIENQIFSFISEPDKGIYHAMNKGIKMAKGEYIHFLNSGDWLVDEFVVEKMLNELNNLIYSGQKPDVFVGNKISVRPDGKIRKCRNENKIISVYTFYRGTIEHTSAYILKSLFDVYGFYDEELKIVSDWKWYLQAVGLGSAKVFFTENFVSFFDTTGISSTSYDLEMKERRYVLEQLIPSRILLDYDRFYFSIEQFIRLKRYPPIYFIFYFIERLLFKFDKWHQKSWIWRKSV